MVRLCLVLTNFDALQCNLSGTPDLSPHTDSGESNCVVPAYASAFKCVRVHECVRPPHTRLRERTLVCALTS